LKMALPFSKHLRRIQEDVAATASVVVAVAACEGVVVAVEHLPDASSRRRSPSERSNPPSNLKV